MKENVSCIKGLPCIKEWTCIEILQLSVHLWKGLMKMNGWDVFSKLSVRHRSNAEVKRIVGIFKKNNETVAEEQSLMIQGDNNNYTADFIKLLGPFYLNL